MYTHPKRFYALPGIVFILGIFFGFILPPSYTNQKQGIQKIRQQIDTAKISYDSIGQLFTRELVTNLIPYWYGTPWSFEGYTATPKKGSIACGYFVSTTLRDMGLNIDRYKLAQQNPLNEARSINLGQTVKEFTSESTDGRIEFLKTKTKKGIYFIGFGMSHVGYVYNDGQAIYLIHSNYIDLKGPMMEKIEESVVFGAYGTLYLAEISTSELLMRKWLRGDKISVLR